jgi:hypothetical protein
MKAWIVVGVVGALTVVFKASGPVLLGGRRLTGRTLGVVELLALVTQTVGCDRSLTFDARLAGVGAAAIALRLRVPLIVAMAVAAAVTAFVRHLG